MLDSRESQSVPQLKYECVQAASEIKKAQALDYLAAQQAQQQWDLERPLDRFIQPLDQVDLAISRPLQ